MPVGEVGVAGESAAGMEVGALLVLGPGLLFDHSFTCPLNYLNTDIG